MDDIIVYNKKYNILDVDNFVSYEITNRLQIYKCVKIILTFVNLY